jgi:hypothetical protein
MDVTGMALDIGDDVATSGRSGPKAFSVIASFRSKKGLGVCVLALGTVKLCQVIKAR